MLLGCGNAPGEETWGEASQALNACNETVPANRAVDGIPAYAQCDGIEDGAIWSNNGVDTASSSQGTGWVRTQYGGGYQCTEFARRYMLFRWDIDYQHGNAGEWCDGELPTTLKLATSPTHGDLIVFAPGSCGADSTTGHVAVVDTVDMAGSKVTIVEQNQASRRSTEQSCAKCFLHAVANDGSAGGSGGAASGGAASGGATNGGSATGGTSSGGGAAAGGAASGGGASGGATSAGTSSGGAASGGAPSGNAGSSTGGSSAIAGSASGGSATAGGAAAGTSNDDATDASGCSVATAPGRSSHGALGLSLALASLLSRFGRRRSRSGN